jgi:hypothetical protein
MSPATERRIGVTDVGKARHCQYRPASYVASPGDDDLSITLDREVRPRADSVSWQGRASIGTEGVIDTSVNVQSSDDYPKTSNLRTKTSHDRFAVRLDCDIVDVEVWAGEDILGGDPVEAKREITIAGIEESPALERLETSPVRRLAMLYT